jgi:hypothetical protein
MMEGMDLNSLKEKDGLVKDLGIEYVETEPERGDEDGKPVCISRCRLAVVDPEG